MQLHTCKESLRTYMYAAVQVLQLPCLKFYTLSWKWASFRGAIIRDSLFYHGCNAKDAKIGSKMSRRLVVPISLGLATVTFAGCIGISIAGCIGIAAITITITGTLTACKLWKIVAIDWIEDNPMQCCEKCALQGLWSLFSIYVWVCDFSATVGWNLHIYWYGMRHLWEKVKNPGPHLRQLPQAMAIHKLVKQKHCWTIHIYICMQLQFKSFNYRLSFLVCSSLCLGHALSGVPLQSQSTCPMWLPLAGGAVRHVRSLERDNDK